MMVNIDTGKWDVFFNGIIEAAQKAEIPPGEFLGYLIDVAENMKRAYTEATGQEVIYIRPDEDKK